MKSIYEKYLALSLILFLATFTSCNNDNEKEVENRVYKMSSETSLMYKKEIYTR